MESNCNGHNHIAMKTNGHLDNGVGQLTKTMELSKYDDDDSKSFVETKFTRFVAKCFRWLGLFVADHPVKVLIVTIALTAFCSSKIAFTKQQDDIRTGYTPRGAPSLHEMAVFEEFFNNQGEPIALFILITARNDGFLLREASYLRDTVAIIDEVNRNFTIGSNNPPITYDQFCGRYCMLNEPVRQFYNGFTIVNSQPSENTMENGNDRINLSYPISTIMGRKFDLSMHFFGPDMTNKLETVKLIVLHFRFERPAKWSRDTVAEWERSISTYYHREYTGNLLRPLVYSTTFMGDEIVRNGLTIFPYITIGFVIMSVFSIVSIWMSAILFDEWTRHKVTMAMAACISPLLATGTAIGLLLWLGIRFATIFYCVPFLVMAIGVDDAYIIIHAWQRECAKRRRLYANSINRITEDDTLRERLSTVFVEVGPSITITSLTNILAFLVGVTSSTPEIQLFCFANALAIFVDFVYQITLFAAVMAIAGHFEMNRKDEKRKTKTIEIVKKKLHNTLEAYSRWLSNGFTSVLIFCIICAYWWLAIVAAMKIREELSLDKLVLRDSSLRTVTHMRDTFIMPSNTLATIFVNQIGDLSDPFQLSQVKALISDYESLPNCLGPQFTHFWLRDYEQFLLENDEFTEKFNGSGLLSLTELPVFLQWPEYSQWEMFMKFDNGTRRVVGFFATVSFKGPGVWSERYANLNNWRRIAQRYDSLNVTVFEDDAVFLDLIGQMIPSTVQSSIITLICMGLVCFVFMYDLYTVLVASLAIVSICIGVFGALAAWNIDLDPISMACIIMSIGFSVDFPAHITYHYCMLGNQISCEQRLTQSLGAIGFPLLQCGLSTILFVLSLLFVDTYMSEVFVKTMFLVVSLGLLHGLLIVPAFLAAFSSAIDRKIPGSATLNWNARQKETISGRVLKRLSPASLRQVLPITTDHHHNARPLPRRHDNA